MNLSDTSGKTGQALESSEEYLADKAESKTIRKTGITGELVSHFDSKIYFRGLDNLVKMSVSIRL